MKNLLLILTVFLLVISADEVFAGELYGIVRGSNGSPISNVIIIVHRDNQPYTSTTTDNNGNYSIFLMPGNYTLICQNTQIHVYVSSRTIRRDIYLN